MKSIILSAVLGLSAISMTGCIDIPYDIDLAPIEYDVGKLTDTLQNKFKSKTKGFDLAGFKAPTCGAALLLYLLNSGSDGSLPDPIPANITNEDYGTPNGLECKDQDMQVYIKDNYLKDARLIQAYNLNSDDMPDSGFIKELQENPDKADIKSIKVSIDASNVNITIPGVELFATRPGFDLGDEALTAEGVQTLIANKDIFPAGSIESVPPDFNGTRQIILDETHREQVESLFMKQNGALILQTGLLEISAVDGNIALPRGKATFTPKLTLNINVDLGDLEHIGDL